MWWNWILSIGFQMDLYCNRKTKPGPSTPGMERNGSKWRGRFTLLSLLVTLVLPEDRMLLPALLQWHVADLCSPYSPPGVSVQSCFTESGPQTVLWPRVSPPRMPTCALSCWTWWGSCQPLSPACWHTSDLSSVMSAHPTKGFCAPFYWEFTVSHHPHCSGIISSLLICEGSHLVTGCTLNSVLVIMSLHLAFFIHL